MRQRSTIFIFILLFWLLFFITARTLFLVYFSEAGSALTFREIASIFAQGIRMDLSVAAGLTIISGILLGVVYFKTGLQLWPVWISLHVLMVWVASFIVVYDLSSYPNWEYRIDIHAILTEGPVAPTGSPFVLISIFLVHAMMWTYLSVRLFAAGFKELRATSLTTVAAMAVLCVVMIWPLRGSLGVVEMNAGLAYSHRSNLFANHAGVNVVWNVANSAIRYRANRADTHPQLPSVRLTGATVAGPDSSRLVKGEKPNVVLILLDRFPAEWIGPLGGRSDITPRFNELTKDGILFDRFYANSGRAEDGLVAILNGYPPQTGFSVIDDARKTQTLPFLSKVFKDRGYNTGFTHGGSEDYGNLRAYLFNAGFDSITGSRDFAPGLRTGKWGVPDQYVLARFAHEIFGERKAFFRVAMMQRTQTPSEGIAINRFGKDDESTRQLESARYTDKWLGDFIDQAKNSLWWDNTVVIITADQGYTDTRGNGDVQIPMLWLGGAVAHRDTVIHASGNQADISRTLLAQLRVQNKAFEYSRDMLLRQGNSLAEAGKQVFSH